jgi:multiple sugar transport system permease protein
MTDRTSLKLHKKPAKPRENTAPMAEPAPSKPRRPGRSNALPLFLASALAFGTAMPVIWMVLTSLKSPAEIAQVPHTFLPQVWQWDNYVTALIRAPFLTYLRNTLVYCVLVTSAIVFLSATAAYSFAQLRLPGRNFLFATYLATMMVPFQLIVIPLFIMLSAFDWIDTVQGIVVPQFFAAFGVFLLRQFFLSIPSELVDAASIDGANAWTIFTRVMLPMAKPAVVTLAVFTFIGQWNGLLWPLLISSSESTRPLAAGLATFVGTSGTQWELLMAGSAITALPILVVYVLAQRWIVDGVATSGFGGK